VHQPQSRVVLEPASVACVPQHASNGGPIPAKLGHLTVLDPRSHPSVIPMCTMHVRSSILGEELSEPFMTQQPNPVESCVRSPLGDAICHDPIVPESDGYLGVICLHSLGKLLGLLHLLQGLQLGIHVDANDPICNLSVLISKKGLSWSGANSPGANRRANHAPFGPE
jgi:hypothetical protein